MTCKFPDNVKIFLHYLSEVIVIPVHFEKHVVFVVVSSMLNADLKGCFDMLLKSAAIRALIQLVYSECVEMLSISVSFHKSIFMKRFQLVF